MWQLRTIGRCGMNGGFFSFLHKLFPVEKPNKRKDSSARGGLPAAWKPDSSHICGDWLWGQLKAFSKVRTEVSWGSSESFSLKEIVVKTSEVLEFLYSSRGDLHKVQRVRGASGPLTGCGPCSAPRPGGLSPFLFNSPLSCRRTMSR